MAKTISKRMIRIANGGAVTINLGIDQDGSVDPNAVDVLKEVRQRIRKEQK